MPSDKVEGESRHRASCVVEVTVLRGLELQGRGEVDQRMCMPFTILKLDSSCLGTHHPVESDQCSEQDANSCWVSTQALLPPHPAFDSQLFNQ